MNSEIKTIAIFGGIIISAVVFLGIIFVGLDDLSLQNQGSTTGVFLNIDDSGIENTVVRVSASGELEQDGKILESGGIHEPEFFKRFFASMNKSLFLDENLPTN